MNMFILFPSIFSYYLKRNWNVLEINVAPKMYVVIGEYQL